MKICKKCKIEKNFDSFYKDITKKDGYMNSCKDCKKKYENDNKNIILEKKKLYYQQNKNEVLTRNKNYYIEKKDTILENCKNHYLENRDEKIQYQKEYYVLNKDKIKNYKSKNKNRINSNNRTRYQKDPLFRLRKILSSYIFRALDNNHFEKNSITENVLGCSFENFISYIESQFSEGMSWENHGKWHLDHKVPISWAKTEEEIYKLSHYTNFQPMWAFDNQSKNNKFASI